MFLIPSPPNNVDGHFGLNLSTRSKVVLFPYTRPLITLSVFRDCIDLFYRRTTSIKSRPLPTSFSGISPSVLLYSRYRERKLIDTFTSVVRYSTCAYFF